MPRGWQTRGLTAESTAANLTQSSSLSVMAADVGVIPGTPAYMSPEQATGFAADPAATGCRWSAHCARCLTARQAYGVVARRNRGTPRRSSGSHDFIEKRLIRRLVTPIELGSTGRTRIFHVHHKPLYAAIAEPDNRNRRRVMIDRAIERLMVLDGVLADRSVSWLGSEREKRHYFQRHLGARLRDDEYPRLVFGKKPCITVRYFPDRLPIGYDRDHRHHVFMYLARSPSPMDFRVFILRHLELLNALGFWAIRVLFPWSLAGSMEAYRKAACELFTNPVDTVANRGADLVLATAPALAVGRFGPRSSPRGSSKGLSQPAIRRDPPALDRGRKPCRLPGGIPRRSRHTRASSSECGVRRVAAQLPASFCQARQVARWKAQNRGDEALGMSVPPLQTA
jgi:hypothetical protein